MNHTFQKYIPETAHIKNSGLNKVGVFSRCRNKRAKKRYFNRFICIYIFINIFVVFIDYIQSKLT